MILAGDTVAFTPEQRHAIDLPGDVFLDAAAGSGKTSVLVERFVAAVLQDDIDVAGILTITFTEKAAAQMRDRIRARLRALGAEDAARATEGAYISTIHGFCARLLRAHALTAGLDPAFVVLGELEAGRLADGAFDAAVSELAEQDPEAVELIAAYGIIELRATIQRVFFELRSRGERRPRLPPVAPAPDPDRRRLLETAARVRAELGTIADPSTRVTQALDRLSQLDRVLASEVPWPGDLEALELPGGNGAALRTDACLDYAAALASFRAACDQVWAGRTLRLLDRLLVGFGDRYEQLKRERSGVDFEDLEILCRDFLRSHAELRERTRQRFQRVMVDELQDTNPVQLEVIGMVATDNLFTVGDAQQSIYGFRHADVGLFERRGRELGELGRRATLQTNFRSRPELLEVINRVFSIQLGELFLPLVLGRPDAPGDEPRVELLVADKEGDWPAEGPSAPWRVAEARALARRVEDLLAEGASARDIVLLTRATTDMRAYERALEERGIATYTVGGRGYWAHPQVVDMLAYLRVLANPRDEEALYMVLASPLVGASLDALVLLGASARTTARDVWSVLRDLPGDLEGLASADRERLEEFGSWLGLERRAAPRRGIEELLDRVIGHAGYDLTLLAMLGGQRRLANVRKLMRLGREHLSQSGPDLRGFLDLVRIRAQSWRADPDDAEAPIESEALDAVRLMTIHRAKGLEFEIVCVVDLSRMGRSSTELLRVGRDGCIGLRLARPGSGRRESALAYEELGEEQKAAQAREERRLFYVAMTRAKERLILSGATRLDAWGGRGGGTAPIAWLGPALVEDLGEGAGVSQGVRFSVVRSAPSPDGDDTVLPSAPPSHPAAGEAVVVPQTVPAPALGPPVSSLSYTSLAAYQRCGYRFYVERVLGIPGTDDQDRPSETTAGLALAANERGTLVHALLERLDFRRPVLPAVAAICELAPRRPSEREVTEILALLERFVSSQLCARLGRAARTAREQRFGFLLNGVLITGVLDVIAAEPGERMLVVDYKTDRLAGEDPALVVARDYAPQQLIYALAALRAGAAEVEVLHVFLEAPASPVGATVTRDQTSELERRLSKMVAGIAHRSFTVTDTPHRDLCRACPAEGGLCSWPLEMTRRASPGQLF